MAGAGTVIVGAGQAGLQAALSLRAGHYAAPITLIGDEPHAPYQRPPLSKAALDAGIAPDALALRAPALLESQRIRLVTGTRVTGIDRAHRTVQCGAVPLAYEHLILATGTRARPLPLPGHAASGVHLLRTLDDALSLQAALGAAASVVVIGGGFIGLEVAATAAKKGKTVTVIEALPRLMARVVSPPVSAAAAALHRAHGVDLRFGTGVAAITVASDRARGVVLADGTDIPADLVLVGIGALPNDALAREAGLAVDNGITVDRRQRTSDPAIYAIGDCAWHWNPFAGQWMRLESVQNAVDQAKVAAADILGQGRDYAAVPWFWSDQFDLKLQIAGLPGAGDQASLRGDPHSLRFSVFHTRDGVVMAVESLSRPGDHMLGRKLVEQGVRLSAAEIADENLDLKGRIAR
jgi:3-phenylpropionate/trans-cinnamate dioxygenase ferredoxin reductase subunit